MIIYLDSSVYLAIAKGEDTVSPEYSEFIIGQAQAKEVIIAASTLALDEVDESKTYGTLEKIDLVLRNKQLVIPIVRTSSINDAARALVNKSVEYNKQGKYTILEFKDAVHLATAIRAGADELHTTDKKFAKVAQEVIGKPRPIVVDPKNSPYVKSFMNRKGKKALEDID